MSCHLPFCLRQMESNRNPEMTATLHFYRTKKWRRTNSARTSSVRTSSQTLPDLSIWTFPKARGQPWSTFFVRTNFPKNFCPKFHRKFRPSSRPEVVISSSSSWESRCHDLGKIGEGHFHVGAARNGQSGNLPNENTLIFLEAWSSMSKSIRSIRSTWLLYFYLHIFCLGLLTLQRH